MATTTFTTPSPQTWTIRFKHRRTTLLLHIDPLQPFGELRSQLLAAVHQTNPSGQLNGLEIPHNPDEVVLARAVDANDLQQGWIALDDESLVEDAPSTSTGKGKEKAGAGGRAKLGQLRNCPQGAGLRDGAVLAFKFRAAGDDGAHDGEEEDAVEVPAAEEWDVVVPTLEETYGDGPGDEGVAMENGG